jgi:hypothetical protein
MCHNCIDQAEWSMGIPSGTRCCPEAEWQVASCLWQALFSDQVVGNHPRPVYPDNLLRSPRAVTKLAPARRCL